LATSRFSRLYALVAILCFLGSVSQANALAPGRLQELKQRAELFEQQGNWEQACRIYEDILRGNRNLHDVKTRYQNCLRRYWQVRRHQDPSYRKEVLSLDYGQGMRLYGIVLNTLLDSNADKKKVTPAELFRKGLEELRWALKNRAFCQAHVPAATPEAIRSFRTLLDKTWKALPIPSRQEARKQVGEVALAASNLLNLNPTTTIMEFTCGACYAMDEYTTYLTPSQLRELLDALRGEFGGVGLVLAEKEGKLVVAEVQPYSPAAEVMPPLARDDQIVSMNRKPASQLSPEAAHEMLDGPVSTAVEIVVSAPRTGSRMLTLRRRAMFLPSVNYRMLTQEIAYVQIVCFQDTTVAELDLALLALAKANMKALILDLRGNGGGIFEVAIESARRFLHHGVIASTYHYDAKHSTIYQARNPEALTVPLVVLIDEETASAAEVVAGALKDNKRGRLVGQTTFGKGCTQNVLKLPPGPGGVPTGGLRITVARFYSPAGLPFTGRGVVPHIVVERIVKPDSLDVTDSQLQEARLEAQRLLVGR
jgi:carboxyl-terminal processing protease